MPSPKMRVSPGKQLYYILAIVLVLASALFSILGRGGYIEMIKAREELEARRRRVEALQRSNQARLESIEALKSNRKALEEYAREKGYGRQGEIIQQLPRESHPPKP